MIVGTGDFLSFCIRIDQVNVGVNEIALRNSFDFGATDVAVIGSIRQACI